jgi:methyl-accepting chemotaxis protein
MNFDPHNIKLGTFAPILAVILAVVAALIIATSLYTVQDSRKMGETWEEFNDIPAQKVVILSQVRGLLGYGGIIHHFKDYVLRKERPRIAKIYQLILENSVALTAYEALGLNMREKEALEVLVGTLDFYREAVGSAERLALKESPHWKSMLWLK